MIGSTLKRLLDERRITVNELARRIDVSAQTLYSIIKRDNMKIDFDILLRVCDELDVPVELFYGAAAGRDFPSPSEWELLKQYRTLDEHGRDMTRRVMEGELARLAAQAAKKKEQQTKVIPLFATPAAAGYASPAFGEDFVDYTVPADSRADFAARIQGDSMEPYIADGSVVLVSRTTSLAPGDVGLFFVDGDIKCKQYCEDSYGNIYLFSLNRLRSDADVTVWASANQSVYCFGKVLLNARPPLPAH